MRFAHKYAIRAKFKNVDNDFPPNCRNLRENLQRRTSAPNISFLFPTIASSQLPKFLVIL